MVVQARSLTFRTDEVPDGLVDDWKASAEQYLVEQAEAQFGSADGLVVRDLLPTDLGLSNNEWAEDGATADQWTDTSISGTFGDDKHAIIWGVRIMSLPGQGDLGPVTAAIRWKIGSAEIAIWNLYPGWAIHTPDETESVLFVPISLINSQPIYIGQKQPFTIQEYALEANEAWIPAFEGLVAEKSDRTIVPQALPEFIDFGRFDDAWRS